MDTSNLKPDAGDDFPWDTDNHPSSPASPSGKGVAPDSRNQAVMDVDICLLYTSDAADEL